MEVAGSILDEVSYFLVKIGLRGGVAGSIPDELRKNKYFGTAQPVQDRSRSELRKKESFCTFPAQLAELYMYCTVIIQYRFAYSNTHRLCALA